MGQVLRVSWDVLMSPDLLQVAEWREQNPTYRQTIQQANFIINVPSTSRMNVL